MKVRVTGAGAAQFAVAAWLAVTEHCPVFTSDRLAPSPPSVHTETVLETNAIAPGEFDVAVRVIGVGLRVTLPKGPNVSAGIPWLIVKLTDAEAAAQFTVAAWLAVTPHVPTVTSVSAFPETAHTPGVLDEYVNAPLELEVALSVIAALLKATSGSENDTAGVPWAMLKRPFPSPGCSWRSRRRSDQASTAPPQPPSGLRRSHPQWCTRRQWSKRS